jgi:hypothetical protein
MLLHLSRDSVTAGDDVESHDQDFEIDGRRALVLVIAAIARDGYLPSIQGGHATWVVRTTERGRALAVLAQKWHSWDRAELLVEPSIDMSRVGDTLHFEYLAQRATKAVLNELRSSEQRAP